MILHAVHPNTLTVVVSAGQSRSPEKRELEEAIATQAALLPGVVVVRVPHLYDLPRDSKTCSNLKTIEGDLVVVCWLFDRATHWILDRNGVRGQVGEVLLREADEEDEDDNDELVGSGDDVAAEERVVDGQPRPNRLIYCIDYRASSRAQEFIDEIARISNSRLSHQHNPVAPAATAVDADAQSTDAVGHNNRDPLAELRARFENPTNDTYIGNTTAVESSLSPSSVASASTSLNSGPTATLFGTSSIVEISESPGRRWYPVIDFSRCTNCMECIDFCLFGVYGVDTLETIVVEQADNCRKGCPACSRVCPQNAIMFPQHKTPAIAGAPVDASGMKIDLSKLFGAPESDEDAAIVAARERDEQLILAGRQAVGTPRSELSERLSQSAEAAKDSRADELDALIDQLDSLDL